MKSYLVLIVFLLNTLFALAQNDSVKYFIFLNRNPDRPVISDDSAKKLQAGHMANMETLSQQGKLISAGPFDNGGGVFVIVANSVQDALNTVADDPTIKTRRFLLECFPLTLNYGDICKVEGEIKMVSYQFIRYLFNPESKMPSPPAVSKILEEHVTYLSWLKGQGENPMISGDFGQWDGGFLIIDQPDAEKAGTIAGNDPLVKSGIYQPEVRKFWVAQGAYCETSGK